MLGGATSDGKNSNKIFDYLQTRSRVWSRLPFRPHQWRFVGNANDQAALRRGQD